jgi:hypothetical protein
VNWYLIYTRPNKRDLFLKNLDFAVDKHQLRELFLEKICPTDAMYKDMVLMEISDIKLARTHLTKIDHFQKIEPRALSQKQMEQFSRTW